MNEFKVTQFDDTVSPTYVHIVWVY